MQTTIDALLAATNAEGATEAAMLATLPEAIRPPYMPEAYMLALTQVPDECDAYATCTCGDCLAHRMVAASFVAWCEAFTRPT